VRSDLERDSWASLDPTDGELWTGLMDGVEADFAALFRRHNKVVYNFAFRATASWSRAEDITQATFMTLWRRAREGTVDPLRRDSAVPVLLSVARNEVLNSARSQKRRLRLVDRIQDQPHTNDNNVADWIAQEAGMERVRTVLERLPEPQRAVIELVVWGGLDLAACADVLSVPVGTVKSRLSRARKKLATTEVADLLGGAPA
jgi:RNA polymerase sigma factor (sigma-70 family)